MSLAIRPAATSVLGVKWSEEFSRGRVGVRKNQGTIYETADDKIQFLGPIARFPGTDLVKIEYPRVNCTTAFTASAWLQNLVDNDYWHYFMTQSSENNWWNDLEWIMRFKISGGYIGPVLNVSGALVSCVLTGWSYAATGNRFLMTATWESGDYLRLYLNAVPVKTSTATASGVINNAGQLLRLGYPDSSAKFFKGDIEKPFVDNRRWSADEIRAYYEKNLFR